jgi:(heptosyl)LPS beta-1,4-glucosyltransferase
MRLTAIIIAKNEEEMIKDCLTSVAFCDEVLVVDGGSTDKTIDIAKKTGASVVEYKTNSFADMRNEALKKAKGEWVFYVDADERVSKELVASIQNTVLSTEDKYPAYKVKRKNFYLGNHEWPAIEKLERLFKKEKLKKWYGDLHESPEIDGEVGELNGFLLHYTHRDLEKMLTKTIAWSETEAKLRHNANHPKMSWWRFPRVMISAFINSYITQQGYKAGTAGFIESLYQAYSMFITYARLWELQQKKRA